MSLIGDKGIKGPKGKKGSKEYVMINVVKKYAMSE